MVNDSKTRGSYVTFLDICFSPENSSFVFTSSFQLTTCTLFICFLESAACESPRVKGFLESAACESPRVKGFLESAACESPRVKGKSGKVHSDAD
jgi:hypothetical protein